MYKLYVCFVQQPPTEAATAAAADRLVPAGGHVLIFSEVIVPMTVELPLHHLALTCVTCVVPLHSSV